LPKKFSAIIHAPGRSISALLIKLKPSVSAPVYTQLTEYHNLVVQFLTNKTRQVESDLEAGLPQLKALVMGKEEEQNRKRLGKIF